MLPCAVVQGAAAAAAAAVVVDIVVVVVIVAAVAMAASAACILRITSLHPIHKASYAAWSTEARTPN